jgi:hypothetical protein
LPNWREFSDRGGCYLDTQTAAELGAKPGDTLFVLGRDLTLLGTFDGTRLGAEPLSLDGQSLFPFDYSIIDDEQRNNLTSTDFSVLSAQVEEAGAIGPELPLPCVHGASLVIVRADTLRESGASASLRSVAVRTANATDARTRAYEVARRLAVPVYFGSADGINVVAATPLKPVAPKGLIPPIAVASLIIFNTMLSSIAERKREIHVYTSLGLAPLHVGALFLAEAVTYGLMGSIFGYIIGQAAATLINHFGWLGGITLNYSGTQAVVTMGTVLLVVIVSAIIPAVVAGRIASPSHEMSWRVPAPVDDLIRDVLPFTTTAAAANGVMRFLYDYIEAHREGSIGAFTTDNLRVRRSPDAEGSLMTLLATVWLAPYDLGVRQEVEIRPRPTGDSDICEIDVALRRGSGQTRNWWRLNRVFLSGLRRQLLGWRSLRPERMLRYIAEAGELRSVPS